MAAPTVVIHPPLPRKKSSIFINDVHIDINQKQFDLKNKHTPSGALLSVNYGHKNIGKSTHYPITPRTVTRKENRIDTAMSGYSRISNSTEQSSARAHSVCFSNRDINKQTRDNFNKDQKRLLTKRANSAVTDGKAVQNNKKSKKREIVGFEMIYHLFVLWKPQLAKSYRPSAKPEVLEDLFFGRYSSMERGKPRRPSSGRNSPGRTLTPCINTVSSLHPTSGSTLTS